MVEIIGGLILAYIVFNLLIKLIWIFVIKHIFIVKFHKPKRFKTKISPIYKLAQQWASEGYSIQKYETQYNESEGWNILSLLFIPIILIEFQKHSYIFVNSISVEDEDIESGKITDLEKEYETKMSILKDVSNKEQEKSNKKQNKIDQLNKVFDENFE